MTIAQIALSVGVCFLGIIGTFLLNRLGKLLDKIEDNTKAHIILSTKVDTVFTNAGLVPKLQADQNEFYKRLGKHEKRISGLEAGL